MRSSRLRKCEGALAVVTLAATISGCAADHPVPSTATMSEEAYLDQAAAEWAEAFGIEDPPKVPMIRYVFAEEREATLRACLETEGYPRNETGLYTIPESQRDAYALAQYTCLVRYPVEQRYAQPWGDEQKRIQYRWTVDYVVPCLEERGHPIGEAPSEATFLDRWESDPWYPFAQVRLSAPAAQYNIEWTELEAECPQIAPSQVLWDAMTIDAWRELHADRDEPR